MDPPAKILIAHPDPLARTYMRGLAQSHLRLPGTAEAASFDALLAQLREDPGIELVIVDLDLPAMSGDVGLRYLATRHSGVRVAVLVSSLGHDELDILATSGATLIPKQLPEASLVDTLRWILAGASHGPNSATNSIVPDNGSEAGLTVLDHELTTRQLGVLRLLSQGHSNRRIAQILGIAEGTVKVHINAAFRILGVHNRVSAAVAFREHCETR